MPSATLKNCEGETHEKFLAALLYTVFSVILGVLAFTPNKRHSSFPDFRFGYHNSDIMHNREQWERANILAGNLCALFAALGLLVFAVLYFAQAGMGTTLAVFFVYFIFSVIAVLIVPAQIAKRQ